MRINRLAALVAAIALGDVTSANAQQRPNFSGAWTRVVDSAAAPSVSSTGDAAFRGGDMGSGWGTGGSPVTITQRADSLFVEYVYFSAYDLQPPLRFAYALDGSESRNSVMIGHATSVQRSRLAWRDSTLVITTLHPVPGSVDARGGTITVRQTLTLESPASLAVETTRAGVLGGPTTTTRERYTKR